MSASICSELSAGKRLFSMFRWMPSLFSSFKFPRGTEAVHISKATELVAVNRSINLMWLTWLDKKGLDDKVEKWCVFKTLESGPFQHIYCIVIQLERDYYNRPNFTNTFVLDLCLRQFQISAALLQRDVLLPLHPYYLLLESSILYVPSRGLGWVPLLTTLRYS